jgi:competence protein ComEA
MYELLGEVKQPGILRYAESQSTAALAAACGAEFIPARDSERTITGGTRLVFTGTGIITSPMDAAALLSYHQPIALYTASAEDLELIPGIGPKSARALIAHRERAGRIQRIEELIAVRGIGPKTVKKLAPYLVP